MKPISFTLILILSSYPRYTSEGSSLRAGRLMNQESFPDRAEKLSETSRPALEPHPDSFQWVWGVSSPEIKWPRREAYRSSLPSARVTNRHQIKLLLPVFVKCAVGDLKTLSAMVYSTILILISFFLVGFKSAQHSRTPSMYFHPLVTAQNPYS
jgi:hypothetical protein